MSQKKGFLGSAKAGWGVRRGYFWASTPVERGSLILKKGKL